MEGSYREYHKTAFNAAAVHPAEAEQEAQRMRTAVCSLMGLHPPSLQSPETAKGDGDGGGRIDPREAESAGENARGVQDVHGHEVRTE